MDAVSIRVPYKNLRKEVELVDAEESELRRPSPIHALLSVPSEDRDSKPSSAQSEDPPPKHCSLCTLTLSCMVAAGVQFGWALQLSLLTPYIQTLGIGHEFSSFIWLCGPITGLVVQPCVGIWSDKCTSKYGRRRPFIFVGSLMISLAVIVIGFSADIGYILGDTKEHCSTFKGPDQRNSSNAIFCSWMAVGNILGFSSGASGNWHRWFPFLTNRACCEPCGNLKAAFVVAVVFLTFCTLVTLYFAKEVPLTHKQPHHLSDSAPLLDDHHLNGTEFSKSKLDRESDRSELPVSSKRHNLIDGDNAEQHKKEENDDNFSDSPGAVLVNLLTSLRHLPPPMHSVLLVMALTWLSWFPFFLFDTDWMGREVYHGDPKGEVVEIQSYNQGVREGAFGLLLNSVVLGISSFLIEPMCKHMGAKIVWAFSNFIVFACMAGTAIISWVSLRQYSGGIQHVIGANGYTKIASLIMFALLGLPLAVTYSVPFSITAELTADSGGGQGLAIGVLNLAIVIPQMIVSLGAGPWDALFGGGNIPAFVLSSVCALAAGVLAFRKLPTLSSSSFQSSGFHVG